MFNLFESPFHNPCREDYLRSHRVDTPQSYLIEASRLGKAGDLDESLTNVEKGLKASADPKTAEEANIRIQLFHRMAYISFQKNYLTEAEKCALLALRCIDNQPANSEVRYNLHWILAEVYTLNKEYGKIQIHCKEADKIGNKDPEIQARIKLLLSYADHHKKMRK